MHNIECKAAAMLCKTFMELACSDKFRQSLLYNAMYQYYILEDTSLPDPGLLKPYRFGTIEKIKLAREKGENITSMDSAAWYKFFLNQNVLNKEELDGDILSSVRIPCPSEEKQPYLDWDRIWSLARQKGLSNDARSFLFLLLNNLLLTRERKNKVTRNTPSAECAHCQTGLVDSSLSHTFSNCPFTEEVTGWLLAKIRTIDPQISPDDLTRLQFEVFNEEDGLIATWLIAEALAYAWSRRQNDRPILIEEMKNILRTKASFMAASSRFASAGKKLSNII